MYCANFAGARIGDTAPRTMTTSRAWQICRIRSRARSATRPRNILYRYFVPDHVILQIEHRVPAIPVFRHLPYSRAHQAAESEPPKRRWD